MAKRQDRIIELEDMMENMRLSNLEKSATKLQENLLEKEHRIVQLVEQMEKNTQLAEEQAKREIEDHSRKTTEKINRLKRVEEVCGYFQSVKSLKDLFTIIFEKNTLRLGNDICIHRYESLIKAVNSGNITSSEVDTLEALCDEIKALQRSVDEEKKSADEFQHAMQFYEKYAESVKPLQNNGQMKKFRFDLSKCVKILANSISSVTPRHLQDKCDRFALLSTGNGIEIGGTRVDPQELGVRYVNLLIAKINRPDSSLALLKANPHTIASLISVLWQKFPDFGTLFLAYLYKHSPLIHVQRRPNQSNEDYLKSLGYTSTDNECEGKVRKQELENLVAKILSENKMDEPEEVLADNFW
ncbi:hypothetical protein HA402_007039 [Bradysia odoriphaga]|nr:hypothetical protein HA402_007039 [Bradysia odoriphaga]